MRWIKNNNLKKNAARGSKRHLHHSDRQHRFSIFKHVRKYGPISLSGKRKKRQRIGYVLDFFKKFYTGIPPISQQGKFTAYMPVNFCFIEHPEESLASIWESVTACLNYENSSLAISHHMVKRYSLMSEALLGVGIEAGRQWRRVNKTKILINGWMPKDKDHQQLLSEIGIVKELNAKRATPLPYSTEKQHLFSYKSIKKSVPSPHSQDDKTIASEKLAAHVNACVQDHKLELTEAAEIALMKSVSEVLDNAERHSSAEGNAGHIWYARGYLNSHSEQQNFEVSIFNFGITIADSFLGLPPNDYSRKLVLDYTTAHLGLFDEEQLITVAALQQRYSCKNRTSKETNGQGTIVLIQLFEQLCDEFAQEFGITNAKPLMSIVSGKTHILFDGTYKLSQLNDYTGANMDDEQWIIAFNQQNSLKSPPDSKYVRKLNQAYFPGVAISIRFPLKEEND